MILKKLGRSIEQCSNYVSNQHYVLEANTSLQFNLDSWIQRAIVQTETQFDITVFGSCLLFANIGTELKPTFTKNDYIRSLAINETVSVCGIKKRL